MDTHLLALRLSRKRDVVEARQRARQIAGFLGFDAVEQACIAAGTFSLACRVYRKQPGMIAFFQIKGDALHVFFGKRTGSVSDDMRIEKPLPGQPYFAEADIKWMVRELARHPAPTIFEEMEKLNEEIVQALLNDGRQRRSAQRFPRDKTA